MKKLKYTLLIFLLFFVACWLFFPWSAVQSYVTERAFKIAANNAIFVSAREFSAQGVFDTEFVYTGVQADFPLFLHFETDSLTVNPKILASLLGKKSVSVQLGKGALVPATKQRLEWNGGSLEISADKNCVHVRDIALTGDFSVRGFIEVSRSDGRISRAQLTMRIPDTAELAFQFLSKGALQGLSKDASGNWRLVR